MNQQHLQGEQWKAETLAEREKEAALRAKVEEYSKLFDEMCATRHEYGQTKYSEFTFLSAPTLQMAMEEIVDLANYAKYTFIKVALLKETIMQATLQAQAKGDGSFVSTEQTLGMVKDDPWS